jgi:hypothetical protein
MAVSPLPISELSLETSTNPEETVVRCTGRITSITSGRCKPRFAVILLMGSELRPM